MSAEFYLAPIICIVALGLLFCCCWEGIKIISSSYLHMLNIQRKQFTKKKNNGCQISGDKSFEHIKQRL